MNSTPGNCLDDFAYSLLKDELAYSDSSDSSNFSNLSNTLGYLQNKNNTDCLCLNKNFFNKNISTITAGSLSIEFQTKTNLINLSIAIENTLNGLKNICPTEPMTNYGPLISATLIVILNYIIRLFIKFCTKYEGHFSESSLSLSAFNKIFVAMYVNTAIIPIYALYLINNSGFKEIPLVEEFIFQ